MVTDLVIRMWKNEQMVCLWKKRFREDTARAKNTKARK